MTERRRPGRPAGETDTRDRILTAARAQFAERGYRGTAMRAVATRAGVDVALLAHYFGNKDGLFAATLELPVDAPALLADALRGDPAQVGSRLARAYLTLWETDATGPQMRALARSALGQESAGSAMQRQIGGVLAHPTLATLVRGREDAVVLAVTTLLGVAVGRHLVRLPALTALTLDELVARVGPSVQLLLA